jgi:dipeptidyl aminopeptidase/acylaminoacyl peptidase
MARFASLLAISVCLASSGFAADRRSIKETDIYAFQWIADPQVSPDGRTVLFTRVTVNSKHDGYDTAIWTVPSTGGSARQLTAGPRDASPRWSPDGMRVAFTRGAESPAGARPLPGQIYVLRMDGGEARQLTDLPKGASNLEWSPDGGTIAFNSTTTPKDLEKKDKPEEQSDVRVITRAEYRFNGAGYLDQDRPAHIWTVAAPVAIDSPKKAVQLTAGRFAESEFVWSHDGAEILFATNRDLEPYYKPPTEEIYSVPAKGGEPRMFDSTDGRIGGIAMSPDGRRLAFVGSLNGDPVRSYSQPDLFVLELTGNARPQNLTEGYDFDIGGGVGGDQHPPRGGERMAPFWSQDGKSIYCVAAEEGRVNLKRVDVASGKVQAVTNGAQDIYAASPAQDASMVILAESTPTRIGDLFALRLDAGGEQAQITDINRELFGQLKVTEPEMIWYKSFDGRRIQAWVQRPPVWDASKKYPMILNIHGGPHAAYGYTFDHEFQWMAAKGYVVLYPNPRGSTSYGQEFGNSIQFHYPGDDYKDLMAGVDDLIARGCVDPARLGVTGGSGGGVLTNWTIGQTNRFKAAVSQRSIADWRDFWYTADFTLFQATWFRDAPWREESDFKARSPITNIEKITTPLMLIEGEADMRTPPGAGGEQMFRALKYLKRPVVMVQFPGETHELSRSGRPKHRVERLQHIVAWFDRYLMGQDIKTYDVQ